MNYNILINRFLMICAITLLLGAVPCLAAPLSQDLSADFSYTNTLGQPVHLPAITTADTPDVITNKFLGLIRYSYEMGKNLVINVPAGTWKINKTLYLDQMNPVSGTQTEVSLVGAGQTTTIIQGAPGYEALPLVMSGKYLTEPRAELYPNAQETNAYHHPQVNGLSVYDASVTTTKYGLRTMSTPPGAVNNRGAWTASTAYAVNDQVTVDTDTFVCTVAHTADSASPWVNKPYWGTNWRACWRLSNSCVNGFFIDSPFTAGPLDVTKPGQPTYWKNTDQFTLDVSVRNNTTNPMSGEIAIISMGDLASGFRGACWALEADGTGLYFRINVPSGIANEGDTGQYIRANLGPAPGFGNHEITVQIDFRDPQRQLAAWVDKVQVGVNIEAYPNYQWSGPWASYQLPVGTRLPCYTDDPFQLGCGKRAFAGTVEPGQDWTYCGVKLSNAVRYQVRNIGDAQLLTGGGTPTDSGRYFTNDANTVALLPLEDAPPADTDYLNPAWTLVKVQHGYAATPNGQTPHYGYGFWQNLCQKLHNSMELRNLTLRVPDTVYGAAYSTYVGYGVNMKNVTLDGGFNCFDHWQSGCNNWILRLRNVTMQNAANAGLYSGGQAMYLADNLTVQNCGRYGIFAHFCGGDWTNLTLSAGPYTEYLFMQPADQSQGQQLNGVTINADTIDNTPTKGVFSIGYQSVGVTGPSSFSMKNVTALHLPAGINFIEFPEHWHGGWWPEGYLTIKNVNFSVDNGGKLAAFVCVQTPRWHGRIYDCTQALSQYVNTWIDQKSGAIPWHVYTSGTYLVGDVVEYNGKLYRCIASHGDCQQTGDTLRRQPEVGTDWQSYWQLYKTTNVMLVHPDFTALPTSGYWTEGCHTLQIPTGVLWGDGHTYTDFRCVQSGEAGDPNPANRPKWAPVITNPPTVAMTSPSAGNYLPNCTLTLSATASDSDGSITKVEFYTNTGQYLADGVVSGSVYTYTWSNVPAGVYSLTAKAYDTNAASTVSTPVNVTVANIPTTGLLLWLAADNIAGKNNGDPITSWNDASGAGRNAVSVGGAAPVYTTKVFNGKPVVRFNGNSLLQVSALPLGPYSIVTVYKTAGSNEIVYEQSDSMLFNQNGNFLYTGTDSTVSVKRAGSQTGKDLVLANAGTWAANCDVPIMTLDQFGGTDASEAFSINNSPQWLNQNYTGNLNTTAVATDHFNIGQRGMGGLALHGDIAELIVYDHVLNSTEKQQLNTVLFPKYALDAAPTVSLTAPVNGAIFTAPANITLTASASDSDGSVSKVGFYNGTTLIGTASSSPFSFTWNGVGVGSYTLTAIAYDNHNVSTVSGAVNITVNTLPSTGMLLWLKADALSLNNNDPVSTWTDVSGNGRDAVSIGGAAPVFTTNVFNGKPVVRFNGNSLLQVSALPLGTYTIIAVFKTTANTEIVYEHGDDMNFNPTGNFLYTSTVNTVAVKRAGAQTGKDIVCTGANAWAANRTAPMMTVDQFGGTDASETFAINTSPQPLNQTYTGNLNTTTATTLHFNIGERASYGGLALHGDIAEIVVYDHVLSTADMTAVNNALMGKYALETPPTVSLTAPNNGAIFTAPANITLTATASPNNGGSISKVEFYNGYTLLGTSSTSPYSYAWNSVPAGSYTLTALAYDNAGFTTVSSTAAITVNAPPTVSLTAPAANTNYVAPASVTINANASDSDGTISKVEFYQGSTLLGTDSTSPYSYTWTSVAMGNYSLTAKAYDNNNAVTTSSAVNIIVWGTSDIGTVGVAGSASYSGSTFTVSGAGAGITSTADAFRYVYRQFSGNTTIVARVATEASGTSTERAGVMMRQNLNANSIEASSLHMPTSSYYVYFQRRTSAGGSTSSSSATGAAAPYWVKLVRSSNTLSAYLSANGSSWTQVGSGTTVTMTDPIYVGLAVTSGSTNAAKTVTFDNVSITQP